MLRSLIVSLLLTLAIELLLGFRLGVDGGKNVLVLLCANVCTNPAVVFLYSLVRLSGGSAVLKIAVLALLEIAAVLAEGFIYQKCLVYEKMSPWLLSLLLNAVSFGAGLLITKGAIL